MPQLVGAHSGTERRRDHLCVVPRRAAPEATSSGRGRWRTAPAPARTAGTTPQSRCRRYCLPLVHIVGGGGGVEARCGSPGFECVARGQGGKGNAVVCALELVETPPEQALDVLNGNFVVRDLFRSGHQAHGGHRHGGRLAAQARCEPFDECLGAHHAVPTEWVQQLSAEQGFGGGDVQERVGNFFALPAGRTPADTTCDGGHHVQGELAAKKLVQVSLRQFT